MLREQELPQLRGELERALHQALELQGKQEDLKQRSAQLEQHTKRLEQLAGKLETEGTTRYNQVRESLNAQDVKNKQDRDQLRIDVNARLDDVNRQVEVVRKEVIEVVQKTNSGLAKSLDARLEEQHKALADIQVDRTVVGKVRTIQSVPHGIQGFADRSERADRPGRAGRENIGDSSQ